MHLGMHELSGCHLYRSATPDLSRHGSTGASKDCAYLSYLKPERMGVLLQTFAKDFLLPLQLLQEGESGHPDTWFLPDILHMLFCRGYFGFSHIH